MMLSSICVSDVAACSRFRSASPTLLEFPPSKLFLVKKTSVVVTAVTQEAPPPVYLGLTCVTG